MDYLEKVEKSRHLGREFLLWLWFESEAHEGVLELGDGERCELWIEDDLVLTGVGADTSELRIKASSPGTCAEAKEALRRGKLPEKARLRIQRGPQSFGFAFDAFSFGTSNVSIPALIKEEGDERFYERMHLIEELESFLDRLYARFVEIRAGADWPATEKSMRAWVAQS